MSDATPAAAQETPKAEANAAAPAEPAAKAPEAADPKATPAAANAEPAGSKQSTKQPEAVKPVVPEKYDLKIPDGSPLNTARLEKIVADAKAQGFSNEQAQALVEREHSALSEFVEAQKSQWQEQVNTWKSASAADKEIGGDHFKESVEMAKRVLNRYASDDFKKFVDETGYGNHPELVRVFARIGKAMGNDKLVVPGAVGGPKRSMEEVFYGKKEE